MSAPKALAENAKTALSSGHASQSTVTTLQTLLTPAARTPREETKTKSVPVRKTNGKSRVLAAPVQVHEDASPRLSPREQYALATETVNAALVSLTEALKTRSKHGAKSSPSKSPGSDIPSTPARNALQSRSSNAATPVRSSPSKGQPARTSPTRNSSAVSDGPAPHVLAAAECARLGFAFLRSTSGKDAGVKEMPAWQLERGMLALVSKLIANGLESLAVKELCVVKRRLETAGLSKTPGKKASPGTAEKETLATLLRVNADFDKFPEALSLAIAHQQYVLKAIAASRKPRVVEQILECLRPETPDSPASLILRHSKLSGDTAKAAKQLESLSQMILALCPSVSSSTDEVARDPSLSPRPTFALKLQTVALQLRELWWKMAKHRPDISRELLEPLHKCINAFVSRSAESLTAEDIYESVESAVATVDIHEPDALSRPALFKIHNLLFSLADRSQRFDNAARWAEAMEQDCVDLPEEHARRLAVLSNRISIRLARVCTADQSTQLLLPLQRRMESKITGSSTDYDVLIDSLSSLSKILTQSDITRTSIFQGIASLAASFALRYSKSYPDKKHRCLLDILFSAVQCSKSSDDLCEWITQQAAVVLVQGGALKTVTEFAATKPISIAWESSHTALTLSRVLRTLLLQRARSEFGGRKSDAVFDNEKLSPAERGAIKELQLKYAGELAIKSKYHGALKDIIADTLTKLSVIYKLEQYPLRRARVAIAVFRLREMYPTLVQPAICQPWNEMRDLDQSSLGDDVGLLPYSQDLKAGISIVQLFECGNPKPEGLEEVLLIWQDMVERCAATIDLANVLEDPESLAVQLRSIRAYLSMLGEDISALKVQHLLYRFRHLYSHDSEGACFELIEHAKLYCSLGYSEKAEALLTQAKNMLQGREDLTLVKMEYELAYATNALAVDNTDDCRMALDKARILRESFPPENVPRHARRQYETLHAQGWLIHSQFLLATGSPHKALRSGKRAVRLLNGIWSTLERSTGEPKSPSKANSSEPSDEEVGTLAKGISKLRLAPSGVSNKDDHHGKSSKGAAFWPILPLLTKALIHLCDLYVHHGLYSEANYYSERAVSIAESVESAILLSRIQSHRAGFLAQGGKLESAELCLAQSEGLSLDNASLAAVERLCARANLRTIEGSWEEAVSLYERAESMMDSLLAVQDCSKLERFGHGDDVLAERRAPPTVSKVAIMARGSKSEPKRETQASERAARVAPVKQKSGRVTKATKSSTRPESPVHTRDSSNLLWSKRKAEITLRKCLACVQLGHSINKVLADLGQSAAGSLLYRHAHYADLMRQATSCLQMDVTLDILSESALSLPALACSSGSTGTATEIVTTSSRKGSVALNKPSGKPVKSKKVSIPSHESLLAAARDCLGNDAASTSTFRGTIQTHSEGGMLSSVSLLLSATSSVLNPPLDPVNEGFVIDLPRVKALQYEQVAVAVDALSGDSEPLSWPTDDGDIRVVNCDVAAFQEQYIDIIPTPWTAVSMCLNADCTELYVVRYSAGQTPFVLRLPFSRHKPEGLEDDADEPFDFHKGRADLKEIIELSDYSCHNTGNLEAKGAKTNWWTERENLDRRLHELLINMENIWFGGFKSVLSLLHEQPEAFARFRKCFQDILGRYLPSRSSAKSKSKPRVLNDHIIRLFVGLGDDRNGEVDLDDSMADLLYFVVDILQFNGERNAYDEIDFDSMAIDMLDAQRAYHMECKPIDSRDQHLVLVLDRRLQAFPWESLPFLEGRSVSRMGSMLSLRECILAMRDQRGEDNAGSAKTGRHIVPKGSGTYILNPSSDLKATQTALAPALGTLSAAEQSSWTSVVNTAPTEDDFTLALTKKSMLLYFGHGAGSQYIRTRAIRKLQTCSEVVWLMGCSSGAVTEHGDLEPSAVPLAYLVAGSAVVPQLHSDDGSDRHGDSNRSKCLAVVATLWDVTDKDIDRFSLAVGEEWGLWPASGQHKLPAKTPRKRDIVTTAPATPQNASKPPKTPKVRKTPAAPKTPARSQSHPRSKDSGKQSLVEAVAASRDACYLRYLNGAAPVVYGVPVYLGD